MEKRRILGVGLMVSGFSFVLYLLNKYWSELFTAKQPTITTATTEAKQPIIETIARLIREETSTTGVISAGKIFVKITNIGNSPGEIIIDGKTSTLEAGNSWQYPSISTANTRPTIEISYDATGTTFLIEAEYK